MLRSRTTGGFFGEPLRLYDSSRQTPQVSEYTRVLTPSTVTYSGLRTEFSGVRRWPRRQCVDRGRDAPDFMPYRAARSLLVSASWWKGLMHFELRQRCTTTCP